MEIKSTLPKSHYLQVSEIDSTVINTVLNRYLESHTRRGTNTLALHLGAVLGFAIEKDWIKERPRIPIIPIQKQARYIKRAAVAVGLPPNITDHRLRASFANFLNEKGVPLPTIQKLMRHAKIETTMIYIETREEEMQAAINLVG